MQLRLHSSRLPNALSRLLADAGRKTAEGRSKLAGLEARLHSAQRLRLERQGQRLDALERMRATLGPNETLARGFAIVRVDGRVVTKVAVAQSAAALDIQFADGHAHMIPAGEGLKPAAKPSKPIIGQGSLF